MQAVTISTKCPNCGKLNVRQIGFDLANLDMLGHRCQACEAGMIIQAPPQINLECPSILAEAPPEKPAAPAKKTTARKKTPTAKAPAKKRGRPAKKK